jgi:hypothetical protein
MNQWQKLAAIRATYKEIRDLLGQDVTEEEILPLLKEEYPNDRSLVQWWFDNEVNLPKSRLITSRNNGLFYTSSPHLAKIPRITPT